MPIRGVSGRNTYKTKLFVRCTDVYILYSEATIVKNSFIHSIHFIHGAVGCLDEVLLL